MVILSWQHGVERQWSKHGIRAVIRVLSARNVSAAGSRQLVEVYGNDVMSRHSVANGVHI